MGGSGGGTGGATPPPLKNHNNIGFLSNTGPDPLKFAKLSSQHLMLGHHRHANEMPKMAFCWPVDDGPLIVEFGLPLPLSNKTKQKTTTKIPCQSWTPSDKTLWIRAWKFTQKCHCKIEIFVFPFGFR